MPAAPKTAADLILEMEAGDREAMATTAKAIIELLGDLPEKVLYSLGFVQDDPIGAWDELQALRPKGSEPYDLSDMI